MTHPVEAWANEAAAAVEAMQLASLRARELQAKAELGRHMRRVGASLRGLDHAEALLVAEWMKAWGMTPPPALEGAMQGFARAFLAADPTAIEPAFAALDEAFRAAGSTVADAMAFRSECAHAWWSLVVPRPDDLPAPALVPAVDQARPFWESGPATRCVA